jgi:hypothetical protein
MDFADLLKWARAERQLPPQPVQVLGVEPARR